MQLDRLCLGKVVYPYQQGGGSELSNNHAPPSAGGFTWQISLLPFAASSWLRWALATHETQPPWSSFVQPALPGRDAHCIPLMLPGSC